MSRKTDDDDDIEEVREFLDDDSIDDDVIDAAIDLYGPDCDAAAALNHGSYIGEMSEVRRFDSRTMVNMGGYVFVKNFTVRQPRSGQSFFDKAVTFVTLGILGGILLLTIAVIAFIVLCFAL